jgi:flagellar biosynthetic protein FlhB
MAGEDEDKTEEPTQKRIDDARKKGDIVYSSEVGSAFSLLGATFVIATMGGPLARDLGAVMVNMLSNVGQAPADGRALRHLYTSLGLKLVGTVGLIALIFVAGAIASRFIQDAPVLSADRLQPKLSKINPFEGAKRIFGKQALGTFAKTLAKLAIVGVVVFWTLWPRDGALTKLSELDVGALIPYVKEKAMSLMIAVTAAATVLAGADYFFTRQSHHNKLKMSRHDLKQEYKESEGDQHVRAKLRQIRQERSRQRMMSAVPGASVIVTNPTHYAVALRYEEGETPAPICVAKGVNDIALKIREIATENEVPIVEDPPLARALYATAELDEPIPKQHYEAVAKLIGYVMSLAAKRRKRRGI